MSLDGFIAARNDSPGEPLGEDGQRLHAWLFKDSNRGLQRDHGKGSAVGDAAGSASSASAPAAQRCGMLVT